MIPVNTPLLEGNEEKYLLECLRTGWISSEGPFINEFETRLAKYVNRNHGVAVSSGSAALDIAIRAIGIGEGDEVIMPTFTIISPAASVVSCGAKPVLVDSDPYTWNMDTTQIEAKITAKTKAILVVHIYGLPVDMDPVLALARRYNLLVVEDAAEMHGQTYKGKMCGSFGDISIFSFYPNKHITTGEGGMILCDNPDLANKCKYYRNLCFESGRRFVHKELGWNYRMTNLQAALGVAQLENIDKHIEKKKAIGRQYQEGLKNVQGFKLPLSSTTYAENIYWVFGLVADNEDNAMQMVQKLNDLQIGTRPFFWCMHEQPVFLKKGWYKDESYPIAEKLARNGFYVPSGLGLNTGEVEMVIKALL